MSPVSPTGSAESPLGDTDPGPPVKAQKGFLSKLVRILTTLHPVRLRRWIDTVEQHLAEVDRRQDLADQRADQSEQQQSRSHEDLSAAIIGVQQEMERLRDQMVPRIEKRLDRLEESLHRILTENNDRFERSEEDLRDANAEIGRLRDQVLPALLHRGNVLVDRLAEELEEQASLVERIMLAEPLPAPAGDSPEERELAAALDKVQPLLDKAFSGGDHGIYRLDHFLVPLVDNQPVLVLSAGRGELLQMLRDNDIAAEGVEPDPALVQAAHRRGLKVRQGRLPEALADLGDGSFGAIAALHTLERLSPAAAVRTISAASQVLRPGGLLLLQCFNPGNLRVGADLVWRDLSVRRPLAAETLQTMLTACGLEVESSEHVNPYPEQESFSRPAVQPQPQQPDQDALWQEVKKTQRRLDELLNGPRLVVIHARKPRTS
jgi:SAM-dependent methyltransferase